MMPMDDSIDGYVAQLEATILRTAEARSRNERTTDYTVIRYDQTQRDRLWQMKLDGRLVDSVLVCPENGHHEVVHMDMIIGLDQDMVPFYEKSPSRTDEGLDQFQVDRTISSTLLKSIVYFAYHRTCELSETLAMSLSECSDEFGIYSLLDYCMIFLREHIHAGIALQALQLSARSDCLQEVKQFFHNYVQDYFDQLWLTNQPDFMRLTYELLLQILTSDWLNVGSESTPWQVIQAWIGHEPESRLSQMPSLIKEALRFGRIPSSFNIGQSILSSNLFLSQPINVRQETSEFITRVLNKAIRNPKPLDGHGLPYDESVYHFRPRKPNELLIIAGGIDNQHGLEDLDSIQLYDYQLNLRRSSRVKLPEKMSFFSTHIIGSVMYLIGGRRSGLFSLDLAQAEPQWVAVTPMHTPRTWNITSVVYKGKIVVIGGGSINYGWNYLAECEQYDPSTRTWTQFAPLNRARIFASATVHNERIYVAGGCRMDAASVEMYDPQSGHWQLVAPMNIERRCFALVNYLDQVVAVSGMENDSAESYNPTTNLWTIVSSFNMLYTDQWFYAGAQLNQELLVTDVEGRLCSIPNLCSSARVVQLCSGKGQTEYSLAIVSSRLAVAFHRDWTSPPLD